MNSSAKFLAVLLPMFAGPVVAQSQEQGLACANGLQVDAITAQRERFNDAIRNKDIDTINQVLVDDVVLITGTDSDVYTGSVRQLALWARDFQSDERLVYTRTPTCIQISPGFPIALEHGRWRGEPETPDGSFFAGRYSAKWRNDGTTWRLEVETYMSDACGGAACPQSEDTE